MIGSQSMLLVLGVVLLLFGGRKLPELAGALGKSMKELKKSMESDEPGGDVASPEPAASVVASAAVTCTACHTTLEGDWSHCPRCGARRS